MIKRRFIAGAQCPKCEQVDKVVMFDDGSNQRWRECVSCGFKDLLDNQPAPLEVSTRVNQNRLGEKPLVHEIEIEVIQLVDSKK